MTNVGLNPRCGEAHRQHLRQARSRPTITAQRSTQPAAVGLRNWVLTPLAWCGSEVAGRSWRAPTGGPSGAQLQVASRLSSPVFIGPFEAG
jgi:hypothetical protein